MTVLKFYRNQSNGKRQLLSLWKKTYDMDYEERQKYRITPEEIIQSCSRGEFNDWNVCGGDVCKSKKMFEIVEEKTIRWNPFDITSIPKSDMTRRRKYYEKKYAWRQKENQ